MASYWLSGTKSVLALDCEMVGVGEQGQYSKKFVKRSTNTIEYDILARVSIVDQNLNCVYDKYAKPTQPVTNYRTEFTGIRPRDIENGENFKKIQQEVADILNGKILVGHSIEFDLEVLALKHPAELIRDTAGYPPCTLNRDGKMYGLKDLATNHLGISVQVSTTHIQYSLCK